jgi:hypothetical protein
VALLLPSFNHSDYFPAVRAFHFLFFRVNNQIHILKGYGAEQYLVFAGQYQCVTG